MNVNWEQRNLFTRRPHLLVKLSPKGFRVFDDPEPELFGRVAKRQVIRKLFQDGELSCDSTDGIRARNGVLCDECRHPRCQPILRIQLAGDRAVYVIDLAPTSARNFFTLESRLVQQGKCIETTELKLTVTDRGHWGEVSFEEASKP
jgi:hypothetical protein